MGANFLPGVTEVTPSAPFRFWCQKVLPLVYDDSLSYYELLCKVVNYLNNTMQDVSQLVQAYAQLESYVNEYFENLDVQQEINHKLDSMAEDGTLTQLIGNYVEPELAAFRADTNERLAEQQAYNEQTRRNLTALVGSPLTANTSAAMTDTTKVYVYTGSTGGGFTNGHWYYYNGSAWTDGGVYQSQGINTDTTLSVAGMAADAAATGVGIDGLYSALKDNAFALNLWENGSISDTTGENVTSDERIRTKGFIPRTIKKVYSTNEIGNFNIYAYTATGEFVGAHDGEGGFIDTGLSIFIPVLDLDIFYRNPAYFGYQYKLVYRLTGSSVQIENVSGVCLDTYISDFPEIEHTITENTADITALTTTGKSTNLSKANNINSPLLWESGGISTSTGANVPNPERARTAYFLPTNAGCFDFGTHAETRGLYLLAYALDGTYIGAYKKATNTFVQDGSESGFITGVNCGEFQALYPNYRFRIAAYVRNDGTDITSAEYDDWNFTSVLGAETGEKIKVIQYNIGKFNMGVEGGLSHDVATKIQNYKEFFAKENVDFVFLQEYTTYIDSGSVYNADTTLFDPIFFAKSITNYETAIKSQRPLRNTDFSYLHTSGDNASWCIIGEATIKGRRVGVVSGVLNVSAPEGINHSEQQLRALNKLVNDLLANYEYAIVGMDTNCLDSAETVAIKTFMTSAGYTCGNWGYLGYQNTYNPNVQMYHAIDNVFVKGNMKIVNFTVPDVYADLSSDHYPVIAEIRM